MPTIPSLAICLVLAPCLLSLVCAGHMDDNIAEDSQNVENIKQVIQPILEEMHPPRDCQDVSLKKPTSGVFYLRPGEGPKVAGYCDMDIDGGGWNVFLRRGKDDPQVDFKGTWDQYRWGLGSLCSEFWWGNEYVWRATSQLDRVYELRIDLESVNGERTYAVYEDFKLGPPGDNFALHVGRFVRGNAADSMTEHNLRPFSTVDRDNDKWRWNCAASRTGGWWYHSNCIGSHLTGLQWYQPLKLDCEFQRILWKKTGHYRAVQMMFRPTKKLRPGWNKNFWSSESSNNMDMC